MCSVHIAASDDLFLQVIQIPTYFVILFNGKKRRCDQFESLCDKADNPFVALDPKFASAIHANQAA